MKVKIRFCNRSQMSSHLENILYTFGKMYRCCSSMSPYVGIHFDPNYAVSIFLEIKGPAFVRDGIFNFVKSIFFFLFNYPVHCYSKYNK